MRTILVPTDFSENAFVAASYACALAGATNQRVQLLHIYIALYAGFGEEGNSVKQIRMAETESVTAMRNLQDTLMTQFPNVDITGECIKGFMIDEVVEKLKSNAYSLVVMGTKGVTNITESILGSTTYEVIKKSPVPVLVVPVDTPDFSLQRVGFFTAYDDHELDALMMLRRAIPLEPHLSMLHFHADGDRAPEKEMSHWQQKVEAAFPDWPISCKTIAAEKVDINAVTQEAEADGLDLLIFVRPHKSFFEKIFRSSLTKTMANYPAIPSLFIKT